MTDDSPSQAGALVNLAGEATVEAGARLLAEHRVTRISTRDGRTRATVIDGQSHRVDLRSTARGLDGSCSCPESDGFDFCKHCVAVALALQARADRARELAQIEPGDRMRQFLTDLPQDTLVELLLQAADDHADVHDRLVLKADAAHGLIDAKGLRKMMTAALPLRRVVDWRKVAEYFARATAAIDSLGSVANEVRAADLLAAVVHAIDRLGKVLERIDDGDGNRWQLQERLRRVHIAALTRLELPPAELATHILDLVLNDETDMFNDVLEHYSEVLGDSGTDAFYVQVKERLEALPDLAFGADFEEKYPYLRLASLLRGRLDAEGDIAGKIALAKRTCTSAIDCRRIAQLYLELPDLEQAQVWLTRAEGAPGHRQAEFATRVALHRAREEWPAAVEAQRRLFESQPTLGALKVLEELAARASNLRDVRAVAKTLLRSRIDNHSRDRSACAEVLAHMLREDGDDKAANALLLNRVENEKTLMQEAEALAEVDARTAQALAARAIDVCVRRGQGEGYRQATALLPRAAIVCGTSGNDAYPKFLNGLRVRHKSRRPFLALVARVERAARR